MWLWAAVGSAILLGIYDVFKKQASTRNDVLHILLYATALSTVLLSPFILTSVFGWHWLDGTVFVSGPGSLRDHLLVLLTEKNLRIEDVAAELRQRHDPEWDKKRREAKAAGKMK